MKARTKKVLSLLVTLCMVIGLLPGMSVTAAAASDPYVTVNNNVYLSAAKPYYVNGKAQADDPGILGANGYTAKAEFATSGESTTATLTLKNYNGGRISYRYGDLTVVADGSNVIDSPRYEGISASGDLTVRGGTPGKETDSLTVTSANGCISADADLTIQDLKELNCSSTAAYNNCVKGNGALTLQNIGTARISLPNAGGGYASLLGRTSVSVTGVDDLEVSCGGDCVYSSSSTFGNIVISAAKVALYSKAGSAICNYGGDIAVIAGTLIAVTDSGAVIRAMNYSGAGSESTASVKATVGLYIKGAVTQSSGNPTVKLNETDISRVDGVYSGRPAGIATDTATITIEAAERSKPYSGQPVTVAVTSSVAGLTYIYTWYDESGHPLGGTAPVDAGNYKLRVYAYGTVGNVAYTGDTGATLIEVTVSKKDVVNEYAKTASAYITNGVNLITLPEIPSGMVFGAPVCCGEDGSDWSAPEGVTLTPTLSGNLLSVQAGGLTADKYYVKVPVEAGGKSNYNDYDIILTLTNLTGKAIFDRCDGSEPALVDVSSTYTLPDTTLYSAKAGSENLDGAWQAAIGDAKMYGYEFAGWYTAPNGWGAQVSDENGKDPANSEQNATFTPGTTYYAKWVWTISYVDAEPIDGSYSDVNYVYGVLSTPRTVYTTCLDFSDQKMDSDKLKTGSGYKWDKDQKTLTLDGVHIQALDSVCGIILPAGSTIKVVSLTGDTEYERFCDGSGNLLSDEAAEKYAGYSKASNIISCGSVDATADVFCKGDLTIHSDASNSGEDGVGLGNWLKTEQGGIKTAAGTLTIQNTNIEASCLRADGDITVKDSLIFATNYSSTFTGERYVRSESGSVTIEQGWVFTEWLQAGTNLSISGRESRIRASFGASAGEKITISNSGYKNASGDNFALDFGNEENALWGLYAKNIEISGSLLNSSAIMTGEKLTVSGGSEVNAHGSRTAMPICIYGGGSISNSTVNVTEVDSGSVGIYSTAPLTINRSTVNITKASDATPAAAILVIAPENSTGLVLNSSAITVPSGGTVEKMVPTENNDDKTALWYIVNSDDTLADEVTISPVYYDPTYPVTAADAEHGAVSVFPKIAAWGTSVTVTVTPDAGYVLDRLTVTDSSGRELALTDRGEGKYTFVMPVSEALVTASFRAEAPAPCDGGEGCPSHTYTDVDTGAWYHEAVDYVLNNGLMDGVGGGRFAPGGETSRAMVVTILWRLAGSPQAGKDSGFTDVAGGLWYTDAVAWAAEKGIVGGYGSGMFGPADPVTREQLAVMLYRYAKLQGKGFVGSWMFPLDYADADRVSGWAYEAMCWMTMNGVIQGRGGSVLAPQGPATRAEAAAMLMRFAESVK